MTTDAQPDEQVLAFLRAADPLQHARLPELTLGPTELQAKSMSLVIAPKLDAELRKLSRRGPTAARHAVRGRWSGVSWLRGGHRHRPTGAEQQVKSRGVSRRGLLAGFAGVGTTLALAFLWPDPAIAGPATLELDLSDAAPPAQRKLNELIATLPAATEAAVSGQTTYVHFQRWSLDTIRRGSSFVAQDEKLWWKPDHWARSTRTTLPAQPAGRQQLHFTDDLPPGLSSETTEYDDFPILVMSPATDPVELERQLRQLQPTTGHALAILRALDEVIAQQHFGAAQRLAVVQVLANTPGLVYRGETLDRAGRRCIGIGATGGDDLSGITCELLLLGFNGAVLGYEVIVLKPAKESPIPENTTTHYALYLESARQP